MIERPRIVYLSSTLDGWRMFELLETMSCDIAKEQLDGHPVDKFPDAYDLGISFLYPHKIPKSELKPHKWINFHPGLLPMYRGRNLCYHAIMNDEKEFGATVHYIDEEFDTGEIIHKLTFPILEADTAGDLSDKSVAALMELFRMFVPLFLKGKLESTTQGDGRYYHKMSIDSEVWINRSQRQYIKAVTVQKKDHYAHIMIGDRKYKIVPMED